MAAFPESVPLLNDLYTQLRELIGDHHTTRTVSNKEWVDAAALLRTIHNEYPEEVHIGINFSLVFLDNGRRTYISDMWLYRPKDIFELEGYVITAGPRQLQTLESSIDIRIIKLNGDPKAHPIRLRLNLIRLGLWFKSVGILVGTQPDRKRFDRMLYEKIEDSLVCMDWDLKSFPLVAGWCYTLLARWYLNVRHNVLSYREALERAHNFMLNGVPETTSLLHRMLSYHACNIPLHGSSYRDVVSGEAKLELEMSCRLAFRKSLKYLPETHTGTKVLVTTIKDVMCSVISVVLGKPSTITCDDILGMYPQAVVTREKNKNDK